VEGTIEDEAIDDEAMEDEATEDKIKTLDSTPS
jgi:hypothetical protein